MMEWQIFLIIASIVFVGLVALIIWSMFRTQKKKDQEKKEREEKDYKLKELEIKMKHTGVDPQQTSDHSSQKSPGRHITCRFCGYATPEDMTKCQHCGAAL